MRMSRVRPPLSSRSSSRSFSFSSILRASAATTKVSSSSSASTSPPPPPPSPRRRPRLLSLALWNEVVNNEVLQKILGPDDSGNSLASLGRSLGSKPERNGGAPTSKELAKVVNIHRSLKELGIEQKDLRIAMEGLVGLGLFDSHQPSPPTPSPSLPSSTSPPAPSSSVPELFLRSPPPHKSSSPSSSPPIVNPVRKPPVSLATSKHYEEQVAALSAKLDANPTSRHRQMWTKNLEILRARISDTRSVVKTVLKPREEITARLNLMEELDSKDGGDRVESRRRVVLERLKTLEAVTEAGRGVRSIRRVRRLEWRILEERRRTGRKEDALESNGSPTSASLPAPGPPPPPALVTTASTPSPPTSESSPPLPSPPPTSSPSLSPPLKPAAAADAHSSLPMPSTSSSLPPSTHDDSLKASDEVVSEWKRQAAALETKLHFETDATEERRTTWRRFLGRYHARLESGRRSAPEEAREWAFEEFRGMVALDSQDGGRRFEGRRDLVMERIRSLEKKGTQMNTKERNMLESNRSHLALLEEFARELVGKEDDASGSVNSSTTIPPSAFASPPPPPSTASSTPPTSTPSKPPHLLAPTTSLSYHGEPSEPSLPSPSSSSSSPQLDPTSPSSLPITPGPTPASPTPVVETESSTSPSPDRVASLVEELPPSTTSSLVLPSALANTSTIEDPLTSTTTSPAAEHKEEVVAPEVETESTTSSKEGEEKSDASPTPTPVLGESRGIETLSESVAGVRVGEVEAGTSEVGKAEKEGEMEKEEKEESIVEIEEEKLEAKQHEKENAKVVDVEAKTSGGGFFGKLFGGKKSS